MPLDDDDDDDDDAGVYILCSRNCIWSGAAANSQTMRV